MLISFLGSRGSGKTTVANIVSDKLREEGLTVLRQHVGLKRRPLLRAMFNAIYLWRFFDLEMIKSFGLCGRRKRRLPSLYQLYLPLAIVHDLHQVKKGKANILIYDSNILRGLIAAVEKGDIGPKSVADLYARKILPEVEKVLLVVIDTDPGEATRRWIKRDGAELTDEEKESEIRKRQQVQAATDVILNALNALPNVQILRLSGSNTPDVNARLVVAKTKSNQSQ